MKDKDDSQMSTSSAGMQQMQLLRQGIVKRLLEVKDKDC
nr:MAG TPA: hypothetical protein [Caudoviricetes sp.]